MNETEANRLCSDIALTPGYQPIKVQSFYSGWAVLTREIRTGWERWVHSDEQWSDTRINGYRDTSSH